MYILVQVSDDTHSTDVFDELTDAKQLLRDLKDEAVRDQECINLTIYECDSSKNLLKKIDYCSVVDGETDYVTIMSKEELQSHATNCLEYLVKQAKMGVRVTQDGNEEDVASNLADVILILDALINDKKIDSSHFGY